MHRLSKSDGEDIAVRFGEFNNVMRVMTLYLTKKYSALYMGVLPPEFPIDCIDYVSELTDLVSYFDAASICKGFMIACAFTFLCFLGT